MKRDEPALTDEQLRLAMRDLWRPGWPDDLQAVLADKLRGPLVRGLARSRSRVKPTAEPRTHHLPKAPAPPTPTEAPRRTAPQMKPAGKRFDPRMAAANDLED